MRTKSVLALLALLASLILAACGQQTPAGSATTAPAA
jgi:outer membrane biogenesis lipoprotein LolB